MKRNCGKIAGQLPENFTYLVVFGGHAPQRFPYFTRVATTPDSRFFGFHCLPVQASRTNGRAPCAPIALHDFHVQ